MEKPDAKKKQPEEKMISFRAPTEIADLLDRAEFVTHKDRTFLLLRVIKQFLPEVVRALSPQFDEELREARALFDPPTPKRATESPSPVKSGNAKSKGNRGKKRSPEKASN